MSKRKRTHPARVAALLPAETELGFVHEIGAEDGDIFLKPRQHRLADAERLDRFFIGAGEEVFVVRCRETEHITQNGWQCEMHGCDPFRPEKTEQVSMMLISAQKFGCPSLHHNKNEAHY